MSDLTARQAACRNYTGNNELYRAQCAVLLSTEAPSPAWPPWWALVFLLLLLLALRLLLWLYRRLRRRWHVYIHEREKARAEELCRNFSRREI